MKKTWLLLFAAMLLPVALLAKTTTIYHTSDVHGFFFPRNGQGGFAALEAVLKKGPQNYLLLDSGDFANGTVETRNSKGLKAVQIMNRMGYDAATIGNHEFDFKDAAVAPILANAQFAVLAANFFDKSTGKYPATVQPYKIFDVNGIKVAVIGLANRTPTNPAKSYSYGKPFDALEKALKEVEAKQPNFVVVIVHDSFKDEKHGVASYVGEIAKRFEGRVQVVLGGHAHNILQNKYVNGTLFVESGCYLNNVSRITVETDDKTGKVVSAKSELVPLIIAETGEDKAMKEYVDSLREPGVDVLGDDAGLRPGLQRPYGAVVVGRHASVAVHGEDVAAYVGPSYGGGHVVAYYGAGTCAYHGDGLRIELVPDLLEGPDEGFRPPEYEVVVLQRGGHHPDACVLERPGGHEAASGGPVQYDDVHIHVADGVHRRHDGVGTGVDDRRVH